MEVRLKDGRRADIVQETMVWEIKHEAKIKGVRESLASAQALSYVAVGDAKVTGLGAKDAFSGEFYIGCGDSIHRVNYNTPASGVILYTVVEVNNDNRTPDYSYAFKEEREAGVSYSPAGRTQGAGVIAIIGSATVGGMAGIRSDWIPYNKYCYI